MKITFKVDARKHRESKNGFPIIINITKKGSRKFLQTKFHSQLKDWDKVNELPRKSHPYYVEIINYLAPQKLKAQQIIVVDKTHNLTIPEVVKQLTNIDTGIFYAEALKLTSGINDPKQSALNSFNKYFPEYEYSQINSEVAEQYMKIVLNEPLPNGRLRSPEGVHTYMVKLTTLWNKLGKEKNPFKSVRPKLPKNKEQKNYSDKELLLLRDTSFKKGRYDSKNSDESTNLNRMYWMLLFYLGGINMNVLASLRHDQSVRNGRIHFHRMKGGSDVYVSNKIFPQAQELLDKIQEITNCYPYFTPIPTDKQKYKTWMGNFLRRFPKQCEPLNLSHRPTSYTARHSFINRGKQLEFDERVMMEIAGHSQSSIHSLYTSNFPDHIRDRAHSEIIDIDKEIPSY